VRSYDQVHFENCARSYCNATSRRGACQASGTHEADQAHLDKEPSSRRANIACAPGRSGLRRSKADVVGRVAAFRIDRRCITTCTQLSRRNPASHGSSAGLLSGWQGRDSSAVCRTPRYPPIGGRYHLRLLLAQEIAMGLIHGAEAPTRRSALTYAGRAIGDAIITRHHQSPSSVAIISRYEATRVRIPRFMVNARQDLFAPALQV